MTSASRPAGAAPVAGATLVMLAALGLGGCGQTGPLYLPDSGTVVTRPTPSAPAAPPDAPADTRADTSADTPAATPPGSAPASVSPPPSPPPPPKA